MKPGISPGLLTRRTILAKKPTKTRRPKVAPQKHETKQSAVLALLRRPQGASVEEIIALTDWQPHSVRGFFAGALKRRLGLDVISDKDAKTGERRYHVAALKS
ncbi:MAG TPA: DUF3489 domain-containing protein [Devosia sp.]|nr:DUF3489 domain-containing protein [Devosia sp.]